MAFSGGASLGSGGDEVAKVRLRSLQFPVDTLPASGSRRSDRHALLHGTRDSVILSAKSAACLAPSSPAIPNVRATLTAVPMAATHDVA